MILLPLAVALGLMALTVRGYQVRQEREVAMAAREAKLNAISYFSTIGEVKDALGPPDREQEFDHVTGGTVYLYYGNRQLVFERNRLERINRY